MAEQEQVETTSSEAQPEETLDSVLKDFPVEDVAQSFKAQPKSDEPPKVDIPDPSYDPDGFKSSMNSLVKNDWEVKQAVDRVADEIQSLRAERQQSAEQADLKSTIEDIQESVPSLKGKDKLVQAYLGAMAAEDSRVTKVWEQRRQNPQAWNKVLNIAKKQIAKEFEFSADPQLAENSRAAKASRDQMATTRQPDANEEWNNLDDSQFAKKWGNLTGQY